MKKVIIAGSRSFANAKLLEEKMQEYYNNETIEVVCGGAKGADQLGKLWAFKHQCPVKMCIPKWQEEGKVAGFNRNVEMGVYADEAIVFWDGESRGSQHMVRIMEGLDKPVYTVKFEGRRKI